MLSQPILEMGTWSKSGKRDSLYQSGNTNQNQGSSKATEYSVIRFNKGSTLPAHLLIAQHTEQQHENGIHKLRSQAVKTGLKQQYAIPQLILAISSKPRRSSPMTRGQVGNQALLLLLL